MTSSFWHQSFSIIILESSSWSLEKSEVSIWSFLYNSTLLFDFLIAFLPSRSLILCTNSRCRDTLKRLLVSCEHNLHIHILTFTIQQSNKKWICLEVLMRNVHGLFHLQPRRVCRIYFTWTAAYELWEPWRGGIERSSELTLYEILIDVSNKQHWNRNFVCCCCL